MAKIAIVTGGSRGIGAEISRALGRDGYTVVIDYKEKTEPAEALVRELKESGINAEAVCCDVRYSDRVKKMVEYVIEKYHKVDVLVNNAGVSCYSLITDATDEQWDLVLKTNLFGTFYMCREVLKNMISRKSGRIINISSMWGICGASCETIYSSSKSGIIGLTKAVAKEVGPSGITVNCVAPGAIETEMLSVLSEETLEAVKEETPLGMLGQPTDIAEIVAFLASDKGRFITGQVISPNGGLVI